MKIVIAGGTGLIGKALIDAYAGEHEIIVLSRRQADLPGARIVLWDAETIGDWVIELRDADVLINLAGAGIFGDGWMPKRWTTQRKTLILKSRVKSVRVLSEALQAQERPITWVQASAIGWYGPRDESPVDETGSAGDDFLAQVCIALEKEIRVDPRIVRTVVVRFGVVLSEQAGAFPLLALPYRFVGGGPMGGGAQIVSWIHIDDVVSAIGTLMEAGDASGVFNLTAPNAVSNRAMNQLLGKLTRRPGFLPIPGWLMRLGIGEGATTILDGQNVKPARLEQIGFSFKYSEIESALRNLLGK